MEAVSINFSKVNIIRYIVWFIFYTLHFFYLLERISDLDFRGIIKCTCLSFLQKTQMFSEAKLYFFMYENEGNLFF